MKRNILEMMTWKTVNYEVNFPIDRGLYSTWNLDRVHQKIMLEVSYEMQAFHLRDTGLNQILHPQPNKTKLRNFTNLCICI